VHKIVMWLLLNGIFVSHLFISIFLLFCPLSLILLHTHSVHMQNMHVLVAELHDIFLLEIIICLNVNAKFKNLLETYVWFW